MPISRRTVLAIEASNTSMVVVAPAHADEYFFRIHTPVKLPGTYSNLAEANKAGVEE